jgi:hypothetical protein
MKIKSFLLAGVFSFGTIGLVSAQNDGGFGLKGGIGLSSINIDNSSLSDAKNTMKLGGLLGVSYEKRFGDGRFALDIEGLIANKGSQQKDEVLNNKVTLKTNIFTVDVPVSAKIYFGDNFNIYAGPYVSYIFGARLKSEVVNSNGNKTTNESDDWFGEEFKDGNGNFPLNRFDAGVNIGLEFVTNKGFGVGARFNQGFMDITNDDYNKVIIPGIIELNSDKRATNTGIQIYALIRF